MNARLAIITFVDGQGGGEQPDNSLPGGSGGRPDNSLPGGGGHPDNSLPAQPGVPVQLPVYPFDPTDPGYGGGRPPQGGTMPIYPGAKFVVKWLACRGLVLVPDNSLPSGSGRPDNTLPGSQPGPDNSLPSQPARPDQGLPPTAQPKK